MTQRNTPPPLVAAVRGIFFIVAVGAALALALATPLGGQVDAFQAEVFGGTYSPKLTMLIIVAAVLLVGAIAYVPFERFVLRPWLTKKGL